MKSFPFQDRRASSLLQRVRDDISRLRDDVGTLLSHTTKRTIPTGAKEVVDQARSGGRELADLAKSQLAAGGAYAASRFRQLRRDESSYGSQSASWVGGAVVVGLLGYAAYALYRHRCQCIEDECSEIEDEANEI